MTSNSGDNSEGTAEGVAGSIPEEAGAETRYAEVLAKLFAARRSGIDLGLGRIGKCLDALALAKTPHVVQIAGTNGKGSTANFIAQALIANDVSVGVFSSPHLLSICERFVVSGRPISRETFVRAYDAVVVGDARELTFFEQITAIAAWVFADAKVEVAIYEVGLGGRLDSTRAIPADIGVVTGIGIDHCEFLGDTVELIAKEKAGIYRQGCPAIVGLSATPEVRAVLASEAEAVGSHVQWVGPEHAARVPALIALGSHQNENAAAAIAVLQTLRERGLHLDEERCRAGLASATFAGRLQQVDDVLWVDGAHNAHAAQALAQAIASWQPGATLIVGMSAGKDIHGFLAPLLGHVGHCIATQASSERAAPPSEIADAARALGLASVGIARTVPLAIARARASFPQKRILLTGSLFTVADALATLNPGALDPIVVSDPSSAA